MRNGIKNVNKNKLNPFLCKARHYPLFIKHISMAKDHDKQILGFGIKKKIKKTKCLGNFTKWKMSNNLCNIEITTEKSIEWIKCFFTMLLKIVFCKKTKTYVSPMDAIYFMFGNNQDEIMTFREHIYLWRKFIFLLWA